MRRVVSVRLSDFLSRRFLLRTEAQLQDHHKINKSRDSAALVASGAQTLPRTTIFCLFFPRPRCCDQCLPDCFLLTTRLHEDVISVIPRQAHARHHRAFIHSVRFLACTLGPSFLPRAGSGFGADLIGSACDRLPHPSIAHGDSRPEMHAFLGLEPLYPPHSKYQLDAGSGLVGDKQHPPAESKWPQNDQPTQFWHELASGTMDAMTESLRQS